MFESLAEADPRSVRRWEAPRIGGGLPPTGARSVSASPVADSAPENDRHTSSEDGSSNVVPAPLFESPDDAETVPADRQAGDPAGREPGVGGARHGACEPDGASSDAADALRRAFAAEAGALLGALARERDARDALLEDELLGLARAMARLVVRRELELDGDLMRDFVREALARLPRLADAPRVHLHPLDAASVDVPDGLDERVVVVADATLARGECRVESGPTLIDAGIDAWIDCIGARHGLCGPAVSSGTGE